MIIILDSKRQKICTHCFPKIVFLEPSIGYYTKVQKNNPNIDINNLWICPICKENYQVIDGTTQEEHIKLVKEFMNHPKRFKGLEKI